MASEFTLPLLLCVAPVVIAEVGALLRDERSRKHKHRERFEQMLHGPITWTRRELHIDEGEFATKPHHTHACQACGHVWRPAIVPTTGVRFLPGFKTSQGVAVK